MNTKIEDINTTRKAATVVVPADVIENAQNKLFKEYASQARIPGFRPGRPTADFIKRVINKITLFGAFFLGVIAILPIFVGRISSALSGLSIGGTSVIIVVGVALETVKQLESQMMMRNYNGFLE